MLASLSGTKGAALTGAVRDTCDFKDAGAELAADNSVLTGCLPAVASAESSAGVALECGVVGAYGLCCGTPDLGSTPGWDFGCEFVETGGAVFVGSGDVAGWVVASLYA